MTVPAPDPMPRYRPPAWREQAVAVLLAAFCALLFLGPAISPTRALLPYPPELLQPMRDAALRAGLPESAFARGNLAMGDKYNQSLAWDRILQDRLRAGEIPLWTRDLAGGVPFVPQMAQVYHPFNLLLLAVPAAGIYGIWWFLHVVLLGFFCYRFLRRIDVCHGAALFGMVALVLGMWTQARVHHNVMLSAVLPLFAMLSCTHDLFRHRGGRAAMALLALGTGLSWLAGFAPGSLICTYLVGAYAVTLAVGAPAGARLRPLLQFAAGIGLGLLLASAQLLPVLRAAAETSRMPATLPLLAHRSLELPQLLAAAWPTLFHWPADHFYPGFRTHNAWPALAFLDRELREAAFNHPETAFYAGLAPLAFACGAARDRRGWLFAAAVAFGLMMALGWLLPVSRFLPGAHSGDVKRFLLLYGVGAPVLAALGLDRFLRAGPGAGGGRVVGLLLAVVTAASAGLFAWHAFADLQAAYGGWAERRLGLPPGAMATWIGDFPGEAAVNRHRLLLLFGASTAVGAVGLAALRLKAFASPILCAVTAAELVWHGAGPVVAVPVARITTPPAILAPVLASTAQGGVRPRLHRLLAPADTDNFHMPIWPNLASFWGAEDLATYNPLPKRRMEEFFLALEPPPADPSLPRITLGGAGVGPLRRRESLTHPLADLIGIEWVLTPERLGQPGLEDRTPPGLGTAFHLYRRTTCLPRATFVGQAMFLVDPAARRAQLAMRSHDPRRVIVLEDAAAPRPDATPGDVSVHIASHADERVRIDVHNTTSGYLRLADPYDAGWRATVDGAVTPVYVADHYFRAIFLPPGDHEVVFTYDGLVVRGPRYVSLAALLAIAVLGGLGWRDRRRASAPLPKES